MPHEPLPDGHCHARSAAHLWSRRYNETDFDVFFCECSFAVSDKRVRAFNFQRTTVEAVCDLVAAAGYKMQKKKKHKENSYFHISFLFVQLYSSFGNPRAAGGDDTSGLGRSTAARFVPSSQTGRGKEEKTGSFLSLISSVSSVAASGCSCVAGGTSAPRQAAQDLGPRHRAPAAAATERATISKIILFSLHFAVTIK